MRKKASFTLIEMLIVMSLIALCLGAGAFGISRALNKESFEAQTQCFLHQIALAEELMIDTRQDVWISFKEGACFLIAPQHTHQVSLSKVKEVLFNHKEQDLLFSGALGIPPRGVLVLRSKSGEEKVIHLSGIPGMINQKEVATHEASYPQEILSLT